MTMYHHCINIYMLCKCLIHKCNWNEPFLPVFSSHTRQSGWLLTYQDGVLTSSTSVLKWLGCYSIQTGNQNLSHIYVTYLSYPEGNFKVYNSTVVPHGPEVTTEHQQISGQLNAIIGVVFQCLEVPKIIFGTYRFWHFII